MQTALYLQAKNPEHTFSILDVGQRIKSYEKDFSPFREELQKAQLILFCYPVYTFIAPYQMHRLIELIKADGVDLSGKTASQITTSKYFYDVTAHRYIEENCFDMGMNVVKGLSADMEDLLSEEGRKQAEMFFKQLIFSHEHKLFECTPLLPPVEEKKTYLPVLEDVSKNSFKDVAIVTNCAKDDINLNNMIEDFRRALPFNSRVINLCDFAFSGGCLGCFGCAVTGKCVYKDGFDEFLRNEIQKADAIVYAFTISDHYTGSVFKCYDDRQFCNGHRTVTHGTPMAYIISGNYRYEDNLRTIVEARSEVGGNYLCGVATDEENTSARLKAIADNLAFAINNKLSRPANFYGVGGMKIFRDLIYLMQGIMKADHKFYKKNGIYDFPQKRRAFIFKMKLAGSLMAMPSVQKKLNGKMNNFIIAPCRKVIEEARKGNTDF